MEKRSIFYISLAVALGIILAGSVGEHLVSVAVPFLVAYIAARLARPLGVKLAGACRVNEKLGCGVYAVIVCMGGAYILTYASGRLISGLSDLAGRLPELAQNATALLGEVYAAIPFFSDSEVMPILSGVLEEAAAYIGGVLAEAIGGLVQKLPGGITSTVFSVVAFIYLTADMPGAAKSIRELLPASLAARVSRIFGDAERAVFSYFRSYLILMTVTFFELLIGLSVIGASSPFASAFVIAFIDALPVFGCGTVLLPWAAWCFWQGEVGRGVGLLAVFGVIYLVRQFLEPRLIGRMTGAHPFVALLFIFCGWRLAGVLGIVLAPVILLLIQERRRE